MPKKLNRIASGQRQQTSRNSMQVSQLDVSTFLLTLLFLISVLLLLVVINLRKISINQSTKPNDLNVFSRHHFDKSIFKNYNPNKNFEDERDPQDCWKGKWSRVVSRRVKFDLPNPFETAEAPPPYRWFDCREP